MEEIVVGQLELVKKRVGINAVDILYVGSTRKKISNSPPGTMKLSVLSANFFVALIVFLFSANTAVAQACATGSDTERILCKMDALSQEVSDLHVKIDSIEASNIRAQASDARVENWVSPAFSLTSEHCVELDYLGLGIDVGLMDFSLALSGAGFAGGDFYGSGGEVEGGLELSPFQVAANIGIGAGLMSTFCFNTPERAVDPGVGFAAASKNSFTPTVDSNALRDLLDRSTAVENSILQEAPSLVSRVPDPSNFPRALNNMMSLIDVPASPSDALSGLKNTVSGIPDILSLPASISNLLKDPMSVLDTKMDFEEICNMTSALDEGATKTALRKYCAEAATIPAPSVYIADAVALNQAPPVNGEVVDQIWNRVNIFTAGSDEVAKNLKTQIGNTNSATSDLLIKVDDLLNANSSPSGVGPTVEKIWQRVDRITGQSNANATARGSSIDKVWDRVDRFTGGSNANATSRGKQITDTSGDTNQILEKLDVIAGNSSTNLGIGLTIANIWQRLNSFVPTDAVAKARGNEILYGYRSAAQAVDRLRIPNENQLFGARMWGYFGVLDQIRDLMGRVCGNLGCEPYLDDSGLGDIRPTKFGPGTSGSNEEGVTGKMGLDSEEAFMNAVTPDDYFLRSGYPNPAQSSVRVEFGLPQAESVRLRLFDTAGREVNTGINRSLPAGRHSLDLDLSSLASGTYLYRIEAGAWVSSKTITVNR